MFWNLFIFATLLALLPASVNAAQQGVPPQLSEARSSEVQGAELYRLESGDTVDIRFFFNPELNDTVQIRPDGRISLQLGGEAELAGKTIAEAVQTIQSMFVRELKTPRVTLQVRGYAGQKIFVTGEVHRPGTISLPGAMSVIAAISDAGGIKTTGNRNKIVLIRKQADGTPSMQPIFLRQNGKVTPQAYIGLRAYDVIIVPESRISRMDRWVDQYIKQLSPANMSAGFTYLYNTTSVLGVPGL